MSNSAFTDCAWLVDHAARAGARAGAVARNVEPAPGCATESTVGLEADAGSVTERVPGQEIGPPVAATEPLPNRRSSSAW